MRKTSRIVRLKLHNVECLLQEMYVSEGYREHPHERDRVGARFFGQDQSFEAMESLEQVAHVHVHRETLVDNQLA